MSAPTTDRGGIQQTIRALRDAGWELDSVWDGEESTPVTSYPQAVDDIMSVDQAHLYVKKDGAEGWVFFVLGNDPDEVINDYTVNLSEVLDPLTESWW